MDNTNHEYYYKISLSYEIPYNVLESSDHDVVSAKGVFLDTLKDIIPERYEKLSASICVYPIPNTFNSILSYDAFLRLQEGLPMEEYVNACGVRDKIKYSMEEFLDSIDCEYRQITLKTLL